MDNSLIKRQDAIDAFRKELCAGETESSREYAIGFSGIEKALNALPSAQPDLLDDGTLMITVPNGMLNDVKRVMVDEVNTKNCKVMYQDAERKKGHWIKISPSCIYECSVCHQHVLTADIDAYEFCHHCGAEMEGEKHV